MCQLRQLGVKQGEVLTGVALQLEQFGLYRLAQASDLGNLPGDGPGVRRQVFQGLYREQNRQAERGQRGKKTDQYEL